RQPLTPSAHLLDECTPHTRDLHSLPTRRSSDLEAGKHVCTEKPFAMSREDADKVLNLAKEKGLLVGSAPDTFLGAQLQTARKLIDDGWIGKVYGAGGMFITGTAWDASHPNTRSEEHTSELQSRE